MTATVQNRVAVFDTKPYDREFLDGATLENEICYQCCEGACRRKTEGRCF